MTTVTTPRGNSSNTPKKSQPPNSSEDRDQNPPDGGNDPDDNGDGGDGPGNNPGNGGGEPDDGDDGGDGPNDPEDDPSDSDSDQEDASENASGPPNQLASALRQLSRAIGKEKQPKTRSLAKPNKPDTFDGKDPTKLNSFILQCKINFRDNSAAFPTDSDKVNFTLSFLQGTALQWYEPSILDDLYEPWMDDWSLFVSGLRTNFGIIDPVGDAEEEIDNLRMKENHHILRYNVDFNRLAALVPWDDAALCHRYYKAFPTASKTFLVNKRRLGS